MNFACSPLFLNRLEKADFSWKNKENGTGCH
jgi:hypothetical protein